MLKIFEEIQIQVPFPKYFNETLVNETQLFSFDAYLGISTLFNLYCLKTFYHTFF
jgi:hypothetical protein